MFGININNNFIVNSKETLGEIIKNWLLKIGLDNDTALILKGIIIIISLFI